MKVIAVIPAWNEERTIREVVRSVSAYALPLVVDDGSADRTAELALAAGARMVRHAVNRGLGAALGTGLKAALMLGAEIIFTFDADGQHDAADIPAVLAPIRERRADAVIGSRLLAPQGMPWIRHIANKLGNLATLALFGARVSDSQSGFRAFSRLAAEGLTIRTDGMEVSSEIAAQIRENGCRLVEVPIRAVYTDYSLSKGQSFFVGLWTLGKLFIHRVRR
ncbi:glycosyltransferase family 2 protein [Patescibacteria group bacterium]|nr:MAG: glycosyltransferase family 2 protein [Patescibacteria group bacterium]